MEKRRPHYDLETIQAIFCDEVSLRITVTGISFAASIAMTRADVVALIQHMNRAQFYKSMTSYADHRIWQDVYHVPHVAPHKAMVLYVKFTTDAQGYLLISFKERTKEGSK